MPSLGLLLEGPIFDSYNSRMAVINEKLEPSSPDYRPAINFEAHREAIDAFKQEWIYDNMRNIEDHHGLCVLYDSPSFDKSLIIPRRFDAWMRSVDAYAGNDLLYLNPKGIIPATAAIQKGERRENPFKEKKRFDATSFSLDNEHLYPDDDDETPLSKKDLADDEG